MSISPELAAVYATAPTARYYIECLSLIHPVFVEGGNNEGSFHMTNQRDSFVGELETGEFVTFNPVPFTAIPPNNEDQSDLQLQVGIDNVSRELMDNLEKIAQTPNVPIEIYYRVFLSDDLTVQNDPPLRLDILAVKATQKMISFSAGLTNLRNKPFPALLYTTELYPGLAR
jgi:hypothetical protein